jgi:putative hydrolase of the HAD superfamily
VTTRPTPVRAVIFDWGGTLTPWRTIDLAAQWQVFAEAMHADADDLAAASELAEAILAAEQRAWERGRTSHESARLAEILADAGVDTDHPALTAAHAAYEGFWEPYTHTDPLVRPVWEWLRGSGIKVGVLSNTIWSRDFHRAVFARDGVLHLLDADVYSSELEWTKPHPQAFLAAAEAVGVEAEACVYVGDRLFEDVHGPQQVGMRAIWVPHSDIPEDQRVHVEAEPDAVAHNLAEVVGIVTGWLARDGR